MTIPFPVFAKATAQCHECATFLIAVQETGYPVGHGHWRGWCENCLLWTWFDVPKQIEED